MAFWNQAYHVKGETGYKIKLLSKSDLFITEENAFCFFNRYIDVIECAAIIGFKSYNNKELYEKAITDLKEDGPTDEIEVPIKTIFNEQKKLKFLFRIVMLNEKIRGLSLKEKTDHAFRNETNEEVQEINEIFFNTFVDLGVNILYDKIMETRDPDACLDIMTEYIC